MRGFYGIRNSRCENTGLTWSNMYLIYSIYVLYFLFLLHRLMLNLVLPCWLWWLWSSPSAPWVVIGSSPFISIIHTFFLARVWSCWLTGECCIVSMTLLIVKYSSYNKLKQIFFPGGGNIIAYVIIFVSQNGVDVISSSNGIKLIRSKRWRILAGSCWQSK